MTVSTDLSTATRAHIVGYVAIEGVEPLLFEHSSHGTPTGWSRSIKVCLDPPEEFANEINLGEASPQVSAATFGFQDIKDADGTSYFGKLFATGRWTFKPHARMKEGSSLQSQINTNSEFIPLKAMGSLSANSNGYITRESINWGDTNADGLLNVTKGLNPAIDIDSTFGYSYFTPPTAGRGYLPHVGSVNFAMNGRRVAYYLTTWDRTTGAYNAQAQSQLVWTGRISNEIQFAGEENGTWKIACVSITDELATKTPAVLGIGHLDKINIGGFGDSFKIFVHSGHFSGALIYEYLIEIPAGAYTAQTLAGQINIQIRDPSNLTKHRNPPGFPGLFEKIFFSVNFTGISYGTGTAGNCYFNALTEFNHSDSTDDIMSGCRVGIAASWDGKTCHALGALGFHTRGTEWYVTDKQHVTYTNKQRRFYFEEKSKTKYYISYHPLNRNYNSSKLYVADADVFWADQGDANTAQACVKIKDSSLAPYWNLRDDEGNYLARYNLRVMTGQNYLSLTTDPQYIDNGDGFVGQMYGKESIEVQQVYIPHYRPNVNGTGSPRGPFELLLYPLLSTGTRGYNHSTYDKCPLDLSMSIQSSLVDIASFKQADKFALATGAGLGHRKLYVIDKPTSWMELMTRECKLFGYVLCWRKGKLRLRPVLHSPGVDGWTETLGDNTRAMPYETPTVSMSTSTVVNQYACKMMYNTTQDKFGPPIIITDVDSALSQGTKQIKIEHQGVDFGKDQDANAKAMLDSALLERWIRFALPVVTQTLAEPYINRVFAGDIIKYTSGLIPDPYGSGTRTTSCLATVLSSTWNYKDNIGQVMLMLHDRVLAAAWAPAALVDRTAAAGGFANAVDQVKMVPYTFTSNATIHHDGNAVAAHSGWAVQIIERSPADATNPAVFGPFNTAAAYYSGNHYVQLPPGTDLTGWDVSGNTEYFMTFSDFPVINTTQYTDGKGTWQANSSTELLNDVNIAQVYK